jgi:hypothetical protein
MGLFKQPLKLAILVAAALLATGCVVDPYGPYGYGGYYPGYGYGYAYPAPVVGVGVYGGYGYYGHGYYGHWR